MGAFLSKGAAASKKRRDAPSDGAGEGMCPRQQKRPRTGDGGNGNDMLAPTAAMAGVEALVASQLSHVEQKMQQKVDGLQTEVDATKARCATLETSLMALANRFQISVPRVPHSHWTERGLGEDNIAAADALQVDIEGGISSLKNGVEFYLSLGQHGWDGPVPTVRHDDALLPHWQALADALNIFGPGLKFRERGYYEDDDDLPFLSVENVQLTSKVLSILRTGLKSVTKLTRLNLENIDFVQSHGGIRLASEVVTNNPALAKFVWMNNPIVTMGDAELLLEAINNHPSLRDVQLINCRGGNVGVYAEELMNPTDPYRLLQSLLSRGSNLQSLNLCSNNITTSGETHLSDHLATNPPLRELNLDSNRLNDRDAELIAGALGENSNLRYISLGSNGITMIGRQALRNAIYDNSSLNSVADSNHSCHIGGIGLSAKINNEKSRHLFELIINQTAPERIDGDRKEMKWGRRKKIYHFLRQRNMREANVYLLSSEFGDDYLKMVPWVLGSTRSYYDEFGLLYSGYAEQRPNQLSIFYEILRSGPVVSSLYENRRAASD